MARIHRVGLMGKLYDRRDLEHDLEDIDRCEQENSQQIAAGTFPGFKAGAANRIFDEERQRAKMRLLRTSQLVSDLRFALALWRGCPKCYTDAQGKQRGCKAHAFILRRAKNAIHWATQDNLAKRISSGRERPDEQAHDGSCNKWEQWYFRDKREGAWPVGGDSAWTKEQYGALDYRGWLQMLFEEEEITYPELAAEKARLRGETAP